jgi:hypothetical protein
MLLIIGFFEFARIFDEVARQFNQCRLHIELRRLFGEFHALFGLIAIFLRSGHTPSVTMLRPRHGGNRPDGYPFPSRITKQT